MLDEIPLFPPIKIPVEPLDTATELLRPVSELSGGGTRVQARSFNGVDVDVQVFLVAPTAVE